MISHENNYKIVTVDGVTRKQWQDYVDRHEHGSVFHTSHFYDALTCVNQFSPFAFFTISPAGSINAMLAGYTQSVKGGVWKLLSTRSVLLASPIYDCVEAIKPLLSQLNRELPGKPIFTEIRNSYICEGYRELLETAGFAWEGHYNIIQKLPEDSIKLWEQIGKSRRNQIKKAKRYEFTFIEDRSEESINQFYNLLTANYARIKLPVPGIDFFQRLCSIDKGSICRIFHLKEGLVIQASLYSLLYKKTLYACYIGNKHDQAFLKKRPVDLLLYEALNWCVLNGIRYFDWMGAGKPGVDYGVRDFKLQYGGDLVDFGRFSKIHSQLRNRIARSGLRLLQFVDRV